MCEYSCTRAGKESLSYSVSRGSPDSHCSSGCGGLWKASREPPLVPQLLHKVSLVVASEWIIITELAVDRGVRLKKKNACELVSP